MLLNGESSRQPGEVELYSILGYMEDEFSKVKIMVEQQADLTFIGSEIGYHYYNT